MSAPELGAATGPLRTIDGTDVQQYEHGWKFRWRAPVPDHDARPAERQRLKRRYNGEPVGGEARHAGRARRPFDDQVLADLAARAAEHQPIESPRAGAPNWGQPFTWRQVDQHNCLRDAIHNAFGLSYARIPPRPSNPPAGWGDQFDDGLRRAGLHLELVPSRDLDVGKAERWVALIDDHAVAMIGQRVLHDSAQRWSAGEKLDVPLIAGYVRRRARVDRWGKVTA
jgi:hypothetical protein